MISQRTAAQLLDFGAITGDEGLAEYQLDGAVALHNILEQHRVAYLADEVGMGKTFVALGVLALLRHFNPDTRVLVIAPRRNIQIKWQREMHLFIKHNVLVSDYRVRTPAGDPARPLVHCERLSDLAREAGADRNRDFFARMSSFSLALQDDIVARRKFARDVDAQLPWLPSDLLDPALKADTLKQRYAQALNATLPRFDLVIIDEAHNLKHGRRPRAAARNRVLATCLGYSTEPYHRRLPATGERAARVLLLSATPIDDDYSQLWRQLDVFGRADSFDILKDPDAPEEDKRRAARKFLIRRVTTMRVAGAELTKNLYRREWRAGGVDEHDEPVGSGTDRQRLTVALVQKKVSEILERERFGANFQIGMLASFESFLETAGGKRIAAADDDDDETGQRFDGAEQTDDETERAGVDVKELNGLRRSFRKHFPGEELPHPKMDAVADRLSRAFVDGEKSLVFVRRVRSVDELTDRLNHAYDRHLFQRLERELPKRHRSVLAAAKAAYLEAKPRRSPRTGPAAVVGVDADYTPRDPDDVVDTSSFFAYFFRGIGPADILSGAQVNRRINRQSGALATLFAENHVMRILDARPGSVGRALAAALGKDVQSTNEQLRALSRRYLSTAKDPPRAARFAAAQAAALELLASRRRDAEAIYDELYREEHGAPVDRSADPEQLERVTFLTELRRRPRLSAALLPDDPNPQGFRDLYLRSLMLSAVARLGHSAIDLWLAVSSEAETLSGQQEVDEPAVITRFLDRLEAQAQVPMAERGWMAYDELRAISENFALIVDVSLRSQERSGSAAHFQQVVGTLMGSQQPVAGMSGSVNQSLVRQFRLPGYPLVMITTDLLQEGEDLHTFCSRVLHYGLAWTPSALEQRTGRIDRVRSATARRLHACASPPAGTELLQVHYPHLEETVERLQVRRVLRRMDEFTRLMHESLARPDRDVGRVNIRAELGDRSLSMPRPPTEVLRTAFEVRNVSGPRRPLAVDRAVAQRQRKRFDRLRRTISHVRWEPAAGEVLLGTATVTEQRVQPFSLQLGWWKEALAIRCVSPIGLVAHGDAADVVAAIARRLPVAIGLRQGSESSYSLTVEEDVLLDAMDFANDAARVGALIRRIVSQADALEQAQFAGADHGLDVFRRTLERDLHHGR